MKTTKLLIGAMAVMSFAACQNDALVAEQPSVEGRKQIDVKIVPTESVDSRMINNNGSFSWETTDKLGAALVDVYGYLADGKHIGNAQFNYADGQFTTASTMSVGSYAFYYPYDAKNTTTSDGVIVKTLGAQKFDATGEEMMKNNFMVAPIANILGAEAGELTLPMTFRSIYGYGNLTLTNNLDNGEEVEIQKIVIKNAGDQFIIGGKLAVAQFSSVTDEENPQDKGYLYVTLDEETDAAKAFAKADSVYLNKVVEGETVKPNPVAWVSNVASSDLGDVNINCLTGTTGIKLAHGASVSTRVLIPAGEYTKANWSILVYTNKGLTTIDSDKITTIEEEGQEDKIVVRNSRPKTIAAEFTADPIEADVLNVISKEDFIASMAQYKESAATLPVNVAAGVEVDAEMLAAVPSNVPCVKFMTPVTINASATLRKVAFADDVTLKGNLTIQPATDVTMFNYNFVTVEGTVKVASSVNAIFMVKKGATLNLNAGVSVTRVNSNGTLNIGSANGSAVSATSGVTAETGAVTVNSKLNGTLTLGSRDDKAKALTATINNHVSTAATVYANATVTANVEPAETGDVLTIASNAGTIVNNKSIAVTTNTGKITNAAAANLTVGTNKALVENYGKATVASNDGEDEENIATINQYAGADLLVTSNVDDFSEVNTAADSETVVTENEGEVVYVEGARIAVNGGDGNVAYAMEAPTDEDITKLAKAKPYINKLVITAADYTLAKALEIPTSITSIVFEGNATFSEAISTKLTISIPEYKAAGANDYYERINPIALTFKGDVKFVKGATFIEGAVLTFNGGNTLDGSTITVGKKPTKNTNTTGDATKDNGAYGIKAPLTLNINNGYMTNKVEFIAHTSDLTINFGVKNETKGIVAGSIWNDMIFSSVETATYTEGGVAPATNVENRLWKGTAITGLTY